VENNKAWTRLGGYHCPVPVSDKQAIREVALNHLELRGIKVVSHAEGKASTQNR
jgi:hypothetical protein